MISVNILKSYGRRILTPEVRSYLWLIYADARRFALTGSVGGFGSVEIEVNTHCDRACWHCPNSRFPKSEQYIDDWLFRKIIDELASVGFRGRLSPHLYSEPLLHPDLEYLIAYATKKINGVRVEIYTNGNFLDRKRFNELKKSGANRIIITQYEESVPYELQQLLDNLSPDEKRMVAFRTLEDNLLFNRGIPGLIPKERRAIPNPCYIGQDDYVILVDGTVVICCNDFKGEHPFGNVGETSVMEVWDNSEYERIRNDVRRGKFELDVCKRCVFDEE
jgi:radical SAM protein with 4Fe4S-binding SPASM domain